MGKEKQLYLSKSLTKNKREDIRKTVKRLLQKEGLSYEEWLSEQEFQYFLSKMDTINRLLTETEQKGGQLRHDQSIDTNQRDPFTS
ncbi:hypothetical protein [Enterococcus sp. 5B3_DIV0040]|uniref:hypothetical protein n=1 Tax=Enterococcus sp. 5B3_DIV0040 TaxID=1834182 RepID=UPI000A33EDBE|nr:hypothetical protein [Enterococcus sp. 5B3_DIV0040]OTO03226.1 hypothetical protein A5883_000191 [Enterococcus sp. 5B3_DIV0040]